MLSLYLTLIDTEEDKNRFRILYEEYRRLMFFVAKDILKDDYLAEDAVQDAFLRIAKNFHKITEVLCPQTKAFVVIITRNAAINIYNRENRISEIETFYALEVPEPADELFDTISYRLLGSYILELPEAYRDVLFLNHIYGYNFKEIANLLSVTVETAKKRAQRARLMLKQKIEKAGQ